MASRRSISFLLLFVLAVALHLHQQVMAAKPMPQLRSESKIIQDSIIEKINADPEAGWKASINPRLENYTVEQFKHILGVKPMPSNECDPYFDDIGCAHPGCEPLYPTPKCVRKCKVNSLLWKKNKHFGVDAYRVNSNPEDIMAEIYTNGPVEVDFTVYEDFAHYKSGVYKHLTGYSLGGHAVKLIGWGTSDEGEDYWLIANSWNTEWGDDGYFKILRGMNECGIEENAIAGMPSTKNLVISYASNDSEGDASS